jgi:hypothetical protein
VEKRSLNSEEKNLTPEGVSYKRLMQEATQAAPKPLSMLTTVTFEAQELSMPRSAATPPKLAP